MPMAWRNQAYTLPGDIAGEGGKPQAPFRFDQNINFRPS